MTSFHKPKIFLACACLLLAAACQKQPPTRPQQQPAPTAVSTYQKPLTIGGKQIFVEVASTQEQMEKGLGGREKLTDEQGMLFDFKKPQTPAFWMQGMKFDLDFIWIKNKTVVGLTLNVPSPKGPSQKLPLYNSPGSVDMVLEVNAGWSAKNGIKVGDRVNEE